jgi:hypothetical protein
MAARQHYQDLAGADRLRRCARGTWCSASTRGDDGTWLPAAAAQPLCPADRTVMVQHLEQLPACYARLGQRLGDPVKAGRAVWVPPGSRVPVSPAVDALMRTTAAVAGGWAARLRADQRLARPRRRLGSPAQVTADCATLAAHPDALLTLPAASMTRTWTWPPGDAMPDWLAEQIGGLDAVRGGDGWVAAYTSLSGEDAGLELLDLHRLAVRLLGETPARPELLDGIPCRSCEAMSSLALLEQPPPDPEKPPPPFARCTVCRDEMTRAEYDAWAVMYAAWTKGAGILTCRRCELRLCGTCCWAGCTCCGAARRAAA